MNQLKNNHHRILSLTVENNAQRLSLVSTRAFIHQYRAKVEVFFTDVKYKKRKGGEFRPLNAGNVLISAELLYGRIEPTRKQHKAKQPRKILDKLTSARL